VPRTITDAQVEEVVVRTLEEVPEGATHWSKRELAKRAGISPTSVHRIWRAFGLQPWRTEGFKISPDPLLIDKIRDIVVLYLAPPEHAVVFAVDEKPQIQWLSMRSCCRYRLRHEQVCRVPCRQAGFLFFLDRRRTWRAVRGRARRGSGRRGR
jgi:hypothetical protein